MNKSIITIGKFDAIHKGHYLLLNYIKNNINLKPLVLIINKNNIEYIFSKTEKQLIFDELNLNIDFLEFDDIKQIDAKTFLYDVLINKYNMQSICIGDDFKFGKNKTGNIDTLISEKIDYKVFSKLKCNNIIISSSFIRNLLKEGKIKEANNYLTKKYFIYEKVIDGNKLGRTIGVPTINQVVDNNKVLPPNGVYASNTYYNGVKYQSITNIGVRPSIDNIEHNKVIETHILNFNKNIYYNYIKVELIDFIRTEQKFSSINELMLTINKDIEKRKFIVEKKENI